MYNINKSFITFVVGLVIGAYLAVCIKSRSALIPTIKNAIIIDLPQKLSIINTYYDMWFKQNGFTREKEHIDKLRYSNNSVQTEALILHKKISIFCVILSNNDKTARAGVNTWAKGCNNVTIIQLGGIKEKYKLPVKKTIENSNWNNLCGVIKEIEYQKYEWIVFVHQQTFVLLENLRWFVASLNHSKGYYLGQAESFWNVRYNLAQAGFVLSQGSVQLLRAEFEKDGFKVESLMLNKEDFTLGKVLSKYGIYPIDTRDPDGYSTFNAYNWQQEFFPGVNYYKNSIYPRKCCSSRVITFKGIEQDKFYMYQYLLYQLNVFRDGNLGNKPITPPKDKDYVWKQFLADHGVYRNVSSEEYYNIWVESGFKPEMFNHFGNNYD